MPCGCEGMRAETRGNGHSLPLTLNLYVKVGLGAFPSVMAFPQY
jgi:hypothetical protein